MVSVDSAEDFAGLKSDGLVGLVPRPKRNYRAYPVFVQKLYDEGAITLNQFSLFLGHIDKNQQSKIWFGGVDYDFIRTFKNCAELTDTEA